MWRRDVMRWFKLDSGADQSPPASQLFAGSLPAVGLLVCGRSPGGVPLQPFLRVESYDGVAKGAVASDLLLPTELREHYDKAFQGFTRLLSTRSDEPRLGRLRDLTSFREQVNWGQSGPDRAIRSIEEGINHGAWFVALSPDDPTAKTQAGIFATDWSASRSWRPVSGPIESPWSGQRSV